MARNRASAKKAGITLERAIADYLNDHYQPGIDRMVKKGSCDEGDISGVTAQNGRVKIAVEVKNPGAGRPYAWPQYVREAHTEAENLGAAVGVVVAKRHNVANPGEQWVMMTVDDLITLLHLTNSSGEPSAHDIIKEIQGMLTQLDLHISKDDDICS